MANILLVDDDALVADMLKQVLKRAGHSVKLAHDGEEAATILNSFEPDVMVTDILMPKKSGTTLISEVRSAHPNMEIIAISGGGRNDPVGYLDLSEELGAEMSFSKPVDSDVLLMSIALLMTKESKKGKKDV
jgi:DNA-binding response OmpR family regulator